MCRVNCSTLRWLVRASASTSYFGRCAGIENSIPRVRVHTSPTSTHARASQVLSARPHRVWRVISVALSYLSQRQSHFLFGARLGIVEAIGRKQIVSRSVHASACLLSIRGVMRWRRVYLSARIESDVFRRREAAAESDSFEGEGLAVLLYVDSSILLCALAL
jgi:DNA-binding PucR family transcriptional regulator